MLLASLLLPLLTALPQAGTIDFEAKATAIGPLLTRLSSQTGASLKASPKLAQEIVFVSAKGVALADLKKRFAQALQAEWTKEGESDLLTRTPALEKEIWNQHVAYRRKLVDEALKATRKNLERKFDARGLATGLLGLSVTDDTEDTMAERRKRYEAQQALFASGPMARLLDRLVLACNQDELAAIGPYERRVFRLNPTAMQRGFDRNQYESALASFAVEQQAWIDEAAKVTFPEDRNGRMVSDPRSQLRHRPKLSDAYLVVQRGEMTALFNVNLTGGDDVFGILSQSSFADPARKFLNAQMTPPTPNAEDPVVELSEDSKEFQKRLTDSLGAGQANALSPRMRELMLTVDRNDPLSWMVSDALVAYAKTRKLNVVAAVPDMALSLAFSVGRDDALRVGRFMKALVDSGTAEVREADGWSEIVPIDRYETALGFTPRASVVRLMRATFASGKLAIRDYAQYAFESKRLNRGGIGDWFLAMYDRSVLGASDRTDWKCLQLYGSLSATEQTALENKASFSYSGMSPDQRRVIERIVYAERLTGNGNYQAVEPTDAFPMGVPPDATFDAKVQLDQVVVAYGKGSDGNMRPLRSLDPYTLATIETEFIGNEEKMRAYGVANLAGYAPGTNKVMQLRVTPKTGVWAESSITVPDFDLNAVPVAWEKLPANLAKQIAGAMAQVKANKAGRPGRVIPPR